jgi:predicted kinase
MAVLAGEGLSTPLVVAFTGVPGTGKSTLADEIARDLGAPAVASDWLIAGLTGFPDVQHVFEHMERDTYRDVGYALMSQLVEKQLRNAQSVVLDCVVRERARARWAAIAGDHGARMFVIECVCSDIDVHRSRVVGRIRAIPGWNELEWKWVEKARQTYEPLQCEKLVLDAVVPLADNLARARAYIRGEKHE